MTRLPLSTRARVLAIVAALAACSDGTRRNPLPSIRLSPVQAVSDRVGDATPLVDRDTSRTIALGAPTRVTIRFDHPVEMRRVKVRATPGVRVTGPGIDLSAGAAWTGADLRQPVTGTELELVLTPPDASASVSELEVWGAGLPRAPRDTQALAVATASETAAFEDARVTRASPSELVLHAQGMASGEPCASATVEAPLARQARRAFLVYETELPRSVAIERSLNGAAPTGGFWLQPAEAPNTLVDELDPEALEPVNGLLLCLPIDASASVTVRNVRLVLFLDAGDSAADRETISRFGALADGDPSTSATLPPGPLTISLDRPIEAERGEATAPAAIRVQAIDVFDGSAWSSRTPVDLGPGATPLPVGGAPVQALRLTPAPGSRPDLPVGKISEISLTGSGVGPRVGAPRIVVTYPPLHDEGGREIGERYGNRAYLSGWAESPAGRGTVEIDGVRTDVAGTFGVPLERATDAAGSWSVVLRARFPDGREVVRTIQLDDDRGASGGGDGSLPLGTSADQLFGRENLESRGAVDPQNGGTVRLGSEVSVEVPPGAVGGPTTLGITRKGFESMPRLDAGMINVTAPAHSAYRFLPKGQKFSAAVKVTIPYDPSLLPEGVGPDEIRTYFFDEAAERWIALPRAGLQASARRLVSETTHFTFMINAVLVLPDHPGPVAFNPTSIKDLKVADPSAGIDLVLPPEGNATGSAKLSLPIRVPPARGAYQPELSLAYDSSSRDGWAGVGWDLPVPSVQIDTRFGVVDPSTQEPRYLINGAQIVPTGLHATCEGTTTPGDLYVERIAREFSRIVRCGPSERSRWFEVADRNGTLFVYGFGQDARLRSPRPDGAIGQWFLERVVDANGNLTELQYDTDAWQPDDATLHGEPFRQTYLRSIRYTGRAVREGPGAVQGGTSGPYVVDVLNLTRDGALVTRQDAISSARLGFKVVTRRLLGMVRVSLGTEPIREYELRYRSGTFGKSLLEKVAVYGFEGTTRVFFHEHGFEYEAPDATLPDGRVLAFGAAPVPWKLDGDAGQLGQSIEDSHSRQGGLGISFPGIASFGGNKGESSQNTFTQLAFADVNGDGLPDRLSGGPDGALVAFNAGLGPQSGTFTRTLPDTDPARGIDPGPIPVGLGTEHGRTKVTNYRAGVLGIGASKGSSAFTSLQSSALQDLDGDGYLDWAGSGTVLRGQPRDQASRAISFQPWPGPGLDGDPTASSWLARVIESLIRDDRRPSDAVIEWMAPYPGDVDVTGSLSIVERPLPPPDPDWDGVRLRIYRADEVAGAFVTELLHESSTYVSQIANPVGVSLPAVPVDAGTRLYFVLSTLADFPVSPGTRSPVEETSFAPHVVYRNVPASARDRVDPTGAKAFVFDAMEDFRLAGGGPQGAVAPAAGRVRIESTLVKTRSSANVRYCIQRFPESAERLDLPCNGTGFSLVAAREHGAAVETTEAFDVDTDVAERDRFVFRVESNLSFDPRAVEWRIQGRLTQVLDDQGVLQPLHTSMAGAATFLADAYVPLHVSIDGMPQPAGRWSAPPDPLPLLPLIVPENGELEIVTRQGAAAGPANAVWLAARTKDSLVFEQSAADPARTVRIPVTRGEEIFFEVHSHDGSDVDWAPTVTLVPAAGGGTRVLQNGTEVPINRTRDAVLDANGEWQQIRSPFAGGYHGWRYGAWHGESSEPFDPNGMIVLAPYIAGGLWESLAAALGDPASLESRAIAATSPLFPRRLGTYAGGTRSGLKPGAPAWVSLERSTFVTPGTMHGSREYVVRDGPNLMEVLAAFTGAGTLRASGGSNELSGMDLFGVAGLNRTHGSSRQFVDLVDMNGDGLLDRLVTGVAVTGWSGFTPQFRFFTLLDPIGLNDLTARPRVLIDFQVLRTNSDVGGTANLGKTMAFTKMSSDNSTINAVVGSQTATAGIGAALGVNLSSANGELVDVNGDGLPDIVTHPPWCPGVGPCLAVQLNLGTGRFGAVDVLPARQWGDGVDAISSLLAGGDETTFGPDRVRRTTATTLKSSVGAAFIFGVSKSWESTIAQTSVQLVDVNGDGLPDYVRKASGDDDLRVMLNTGAGFLPETRWVMPPWPSGVTQPFLSGQGLFGGALNLLFDVATNGMRRIDALEANGSWTPSASTGWGVEVNVPVGPIFLSGSYGEEDSTRASGLQLGMVDVDGDGLADHVLKAESRDDGTTNVNVQVRLNRLGKANLLKRVVRPLGGKIDLSYARAGNTVAMPSNRWVMSSVIVRDGRGTDVPGAAVPGHDVETTYAYKSGRHDRYEREFLGFASVTRTNADGTRVVRTYRNDRFAFKELLASERIENAAQGVLVETVNEYRDPYADPSFRLMAGTSACEQARPFTLGADAHFCGSLFPALHQTRKRFYEGEAVARVETLQVFAYDPATGNVIAFDDLGDANPANPGDDLHATIAYFDDALAQRLHSVSRPRVVDVTDASARQLRHREGEYDPRGNLARLVSSIDRTTVADTRLTWDDLGRIWKVEGPAVTAGRYTLEYGYDDVVRTYRRTIVDSHGYQSTTDWNYRFGEVADTTDANGQKTRRLFDAFGRLKELYGPYDASNPELRVEYAHGAATPYARTRHRLSGNGTLDTLLFLDGLGRVLQTKKTAEVEGKGVGWAVSGHVLFDAVGRLAAQGLGYFEAGSGTGYRDGTPLHPKRFEYDALGRTVRTEESIEKTAGHFDGKATTTLSYGFGSAGTPLTRLTATMIDPENKVRVMFRDPNDRVVAVEERSAGVSAVTRYVFDPVGQLTDVFDARGNQTKLAYDLLGRRMSLDNPDAGLTQFRYDAAGNLTQKIDAKKQTVAYAYVFDQLRTIDYPDSTDVTYEYGPPGAPENGAGRIVRVADDAGSETRGYGPLGELVHATRTVRPFRPGDTEKLFETRFAFDAFGRMQWIQYPDGEKVTYGYDAGGLLRSATGTRAATPEEPVTSEKYLELLTYDEFGQRRTVRLGNGAVTRYDYYPESRRLRGLNTTAAGRTLQALGYRYDRIGNVLELANALPAATGSRSGPVKFVFGYDDLYRLTSATGTAESRPGVVDSFAATYAYDAIHNMTRNSQVHVVNTLGLPGEGTGHPPATNHDLVYTYAPAQPHQATLIGDTHVVYDASGNVDRECRGAPGCGANADGLRRFYWTEENRLAAVIDGNGSNVTRFVYDAAGDRVAKLGRGGESLSIGQFFALKGRKAASKHVFAGTTRIATKLSPPPGWQPADPGVIVTPPGEPPSGSILPGCLPSDYQPSKCPAFPGGDPVVLGPPDTRIRPETYYYHSDHLGSTGWVTDQNARVHEHVEYFPYGQVWRDVRQDADGPGVTGQRFLFTGKDLDEETGLYYFGARYEAPDFARWLSVDPDALRDAIPGARRDDRDTLTGTFRGGHWGHWPVALSVYAVANWSPATWSDPDGRSAFWRVVRVAGAGVRKLFRVSRNTAKELGKKGYDVAAEGKKDARRLAQDISTEVGGGGKATRIEVTGKGAPHSHPLGAEGKRYKVGDGPHVFDVSKQGILMFIFDSNQDGQITYKDVGEWLNPAPFEMPSTRIDKGASFGGRRDDWT